MSDSLEPDKARQNDGPDLDPNCLQKLSADDTRRQKVNVGALPQCTSILVGAECFTNTISSFKCFKHNIFC